MNRSRAKSELLRGTLDMLILRTLLAGRAHGHQIARHIQRSTEDVLQVEHGSLYPALHRLDQKGWLAAKWESADGGRELKYCAAARVGPELPHSPLRSGGGRRSTTWSGRAG
jgi:PadR family transcriptional regulator PadR